MYQGKLIIPSNRPLPEVHHIVSHPKPRYEVNPEQHEMSQEVEAVAPEENIRDAQLTGLIRPVGGLGLLYCLLQNHRYKGQGGLQMVS